MQYLNVTICWHLGHNTDQGHYRTKKVQNGHIAVGWYNSLYMFKVFVTIYNTHINILDIYFVTPE